MTESAGRMEANAMWYLLEQQQPYRDSLIWQLQHRYFAERGVEAWRQGEVPHYVTSNPTIANAYAEIVLSFWRDRMRQASAEPGAAQPLTIIELGAGSGRFAFHFHKRIAHLCDEAGVAPQSFRYVLTDVADANLDFWRRHPGFEPFFADGRLDLARFDVTQPGDLALQIGGDTIAPGGLDGPLVVVANYVFDSVPPDLFRIRKDGIDQCLVSLAVDADPAALDAAELLAGLQMHYHYEPLAAPPYPEPWLQRLLAEYRELGDTHLLFPATGLRGLQALASLSRRGALVLSADKGDHRLAALEAQPAPGLVRHGSVSLPVNFHAFTRWCELGGGSALVPASHHRSIDVIALLMLAEAESCVETRRAYARHVDEFGPDGFYSITKHARRHIAQMSAEDILAYLRLFRHDSHQFGRYLPRLMELAGELDVGTRADVVAAIDKVWELYFPLGEDLDLANRIAGLLYAMDDYGRALTFFERSIEIYGRDAGTLTNMAACHHMLGADARAAPLLRTVLAHDPGNRAAVALAARLGQQTPA